MNAETAIIPGCGNCECAAEVSSSELTPASVATINGIALHAAGQTPDSTVLRELAYAELLRQQAVKTGLLPRHEGLNAPELSQSERQTLETMVDAAVVSPEATDEECHRYYEAHKAQYLVGQAFHLRHILFAVTPGVNVHALTAHAEKALLSLMSAATPADQFEKVAAEMSNCPTSTQGGDLGWVHPEDCAPELANELFYKNQIGWGIGLHPRLIHTRFGFHIIDTLAQRKGKQLTFAEVSQRIAAQLAMQSRAKALHQYMSLLVGQSQVEGINLDGADSPLLQ